jgi:tRNA modification GTPase
LINFEDTIIACSSPLGSGAISCIRISGKDCPKIFKEITKKEIKHKKVNIADIQLRNDIKEKCVLTSYLSPNSYTGEDTIEVSCHGNPIIVELVLSFLNDLGCRHAEPGEFTMRAYLNEKISLIEAEAISDLISAESLEKIKIVNKSLKGEFQIETNKIILILKKLRTETEGEIDFNDQETNIDLSGLKTKIKDFNNLLAEFNSKIEDAVLVNEGVKTIITGPENAGKSTLMNILTRNNTSIVSEVPGTTRDLISKSVKIQGIKFEFIDSAGFSQKEQGALEKIGADKAKAALREANLIIELKDPENLDYKMSYPKDLKIIKVINKSDLLKEKCEDQLYISAKFEQNIEELEESLIGAVFFNKSKALNGFSARSRHSKLLALSLKESLMAENLCDESSIELCAEHLKMASDLLGQIQNPYSSDDLLGEIFSSFCIGK